MSTPDCLDRLPADVRGWDRLRRPIWLFDPVSCRGLYANKPALELWNAESLGELLSRDFSQLSPAVRARTERLAQATAGGEAITERWTFYPRGEPVTVQAVISSFPFDEGRSVLLFEAAAVDVEEGERRAVEALRHTSSLITLFDGEGAPIFTNPAAYATYGVDGVGFIKRFCDQALGTDTFTRVMSGEVLAELTLVRTLNGERSHHLDARRVLDPVSGQAVVLLSERDVTAQVSAERELAAAQERVDVAVAKQRFLANMSHELRTPLNSILGFSSLLASRLEGEEADHLSRIQDAGQGLLTIVNDVIALAELDGGEFRAAAQPFDIVEVLQGALKAVAAAAQAKGLDLALEVPEGMPGLVGDPARLREVVVRYLDNAVKFTDVGQISLSLGAAPEGEDSALIEISVSDTGPGVAQSAMARLFDRFAPGDDSTVKRHGGAGLGLSIVRETVARMGGEVGVESAPGEGARFWLRLVLPMEDSACESAAAPVESHGALRVLYADDHENNRALVQAVLATQGHHCETVCDGAQAVDAASRGEFDLILMDIQMPVMDGVAAARAIRAFDGPAGAVPILAVTANTLSEQVETYRAAGMDDLVAKPVAMGDLIAKAAQWGAVSQGSRAAA